MVVVVVVESFWLHKAGVKLTNLYITFGDLALDSQPDLLSLVGALEKLKAWFKYATVSLSQERASVCWLLLVTSTFAFDAVNGELELLSVARVFH